MVNRHIKTIKYNVKRNSKMSFEKDCYNWDFWSYRIKNCKSKGSCIGCGCNVDLKVDICPSCESIYTKVFNDEMEKLDSKLYK